MGKSVLSRTAAVVVMTSALAWNLPVLAQNDTDDSTRVTLTSGADADEMLEYGGDALQADAESSEPQS